MKWDLHGVIIEGLSNHATLAKRWQDSFAALPTSDDTAEIRCQLDIVAAVPAAPPEPAHFEQGRLLRYYVHDKFATVHFPRFGQLRLHLARGNTTGLIVREALETYGVLEDLIAIGLSPHLRRRGRFLVHAFAAAHRGTAVLLAGGIGAGKTTTGVSLLNAGWRLLSNDSPIVTVRDGTPYVGQYPGLLAAFPDTFARFPATQWLTRKQPMNDDRIKLSVPAEEIWPNVWMDQAPAGAILFPRIENSDEHRLERLPPRDGLIQLMPHAIEQWDRSMIQNHLRLLRHLVESVPAFVLHLGSDVLSIPGKLEKELFGIEKGE